MQQVTANSIAKNSLAFNKRTSRRLGFFTSQFNISSSGRLNVPFFQASHTFLFEFTKVFIPLHSLTIRVPFSKALWYLPPNLVTLRATCRDFALDYLPRTLRTLELYSSTSASLLNLRGLPEGLSYLKIENSVTKVRAKAAVSFSSCKNLKTLVLKNCDVEMDVHIEFPLSLRNLKVYRGAAPYFLKHLTNLESLEYFAIIHPKSLPTSLR